jgi:phosphate transport system protein
MEEHTVKAYDQELQDLARSVMTMGTLVRRQMRDSVDALVHRDEDLAGRVIADDEEVDEFERQIEATTIQMISKRQPVANDLRDIVGALRISIDLERIGDFAKSIGKRWGVLAEELYPTALMRPLKQMADLAVLQLTNVLDSYVQHDVAKAVGVWKRDEEIDAMYTSLFRELLTYMMEEPRNITFSTHLLFCAKNIERIGDQTANIAETIYFMVEGTPLKNGRPKRDTTNAAVAQPSV